MFMSYVRIPTEEWANLVKAPASFIGLAVVCLSVGFGFGIFYNAGQVGTLHEQMGSDASVAVAKLFVYGVPLALLRLGIYLRTPGLPGRSLSRGDLSFGGNRTRSARRHREAPHRSGGPDHLCRGATWAQQTVDNLGLVWQMVTPERQRVH